MTDPYRVLGIARTADDAEIKKAYRKLSRIYHPDSNINNPNADIAEKKFKEIQEAYNQIIKEREGGYSSGQDGYRSWTGGSFYQEQSQETDEIRACITYIQNGYYKEALNVLSGISNKDAKWYYLSAIANSGAGNTATALEHARRCVSMEPDNFQYRSLLGQLERGQNWYQKQGTGYGQTFETGGSWCCEMLALNVLCNCCCPL